MDGKLSNQCLKQKGAHLLSPHYRHVDAQMKAISAHPMWGVLPCTVHLVESSTFRSDSRRSDANYLVVGGQITPTTI